MAEEVVIGEIGDDDAAEFDWGDGALIFVEHFTVGLDEHGVGNCGVPIGIEGGEQRVDVRGAENQVAASGVKFGERGEGS